MAGQPAGSAADARVSVLIPTYNRAALLREAIDSVLAQSYTNFEIIVVDDGSTDETREVLAGYGARVRCLFAQHGGVARARNLGFEAARGEYLCILDSDDLYYSHKLALQVEHLDAHPDTVMVYTEFSAFDSHGFWDEFHLRSYHRSAYGHGKRSYEQLFDEARPLAASAVLRATVAADAPRAHWLERRQFRGTLFPAYLFDTVVFTNSMMFRRSLLPRVGPQDPYFGHFHDLEFALRICKAGRVAFLDNPTYKLRYHHGQVSNARRSDGGLNRVKLQRGLLRVARVHGLGDAAFYSSDRARVDALIARLSRAAAIPLVAYGGASRHWRKYFPRRARRYLAWCARHGAPERMLLLVSFLPVFAKRLYFALSERLRAARGGHASGVDMITTEVLPASDAYESLRAHWDRLFGEREREPSVSYAWSRALLRNHLARDRDWFIVVLRRNGQCEGIVPMAELREKMLGQEIVTLQPIQEKYNTHSDLLLGSEPDLLAAWFEQLLRLPRRWDVLNMSRLLEDSPLADSMSAALARLGVRHRVRLEQPSYHLKLPATFEDYLAARSGKFRNYLKRCERDLGKLGEVGFDAACGSGELEARYAELLDIERESWKHEHGTAISAVTRQQGFYRDLCEAACEDGMLHLSFLRVNGEAVAYNLGLIAGSRYYYLKTSYRQRHREYGVASVGRARLIRELIGRGLTEFDFPGAPFEWEQQWTDTVRWHRSLLVYNSSVRGWLLWAVNGIRALARRKHGRRIVFSDPRALRVPEA